MACHCWLMDGFKDAKELIALFTVIYLFIYLEGFAVFVKSTLKTYLNIILTFPFLR